MPETVKHNNGPAAKAGAGPRTLSIDIGGTGVKALILGPDGKAVTERARIQTPRPATPEAILNAIGELIKLGDYDRISVGFPGVILDGVTKTAHNLHQDWKGFHLVEALEKRTKRPVRAMNDAGMQGYGVIEGHGVELAITLGTGFGFALFNEGVYVPNIEMGHHVFKKDKTYEDYLGSAAFEQSTKEKWNDHVLQAVKQLDSVWNPRQIYIGGGNSKHITIALPKNVKVVPNLSGLLGGFVLWK